MATNLNKYTTGKKKSKASSAHLSFGKRKNSISDKKKEAFYRELSLLLRSGVDFKKALELLANQTKSVQEKEIIIEVKKMVVSGKSIWEALKVTGQFSPYEFYSIQIGEETRKLEEVLTELQFFFQRKIQMKRQMVSVLTYPCIVMTVTISVLYFMLHKVVPMFQSVYKQFGSDLPRSTKIIVKISNHSGLIFGSLLFIIVLAIVLHLYLKDKEIYRKTMAAVVLKIPYFGNLVQKIYLSRFCQSMKLLSASKTSLITSLTLTSRMIGFYPLEKSIDVLKHDITKGSTLSDSLKKHPVYEDKMVSMIEVAEQVNQLDVMFARLSDQYNEEINHQTKLIGVIIEPFLIIFIGLIVGVIMISMYAPMFDLSKIIKN